MSQTLLRHPIFGRHTPAVRPGALAWLAVPALLMALPLCAQAEGSGQPAGGLYVH